MKFLSLRQPWEAIESIPLPHLTDRETEAQRRKENCQRLYSEFLGEAGLMKVTNISWVLTIYWALCFKYVINMSGSLNSEAQKHWNFSTVIHLGGGRARIWKPVLTSQPNFLTANTHRFPKIPSSFLPNTHHFLKILSSSFPTLLLTFVPLTFVWPSLCHTDS